MSKYLIICICCSEVDCLVSVLHNAYVFVYVVVR